MARDITASVIAALDDTTLRPFYLFAAEFPTMWLYFSSTDRDISWNSSTWLGNGTFLGMSSIRESEKTEANGIDIILNGVSSTIMSAVLAYSQQNLIGNIYLGLFNDSGAIISDPALLYHGALDTVKISDASDAMHITLVYESTLILLKESANLRYNNASQQVIYSGDKGFEFVEQTAEWSGYWGVKSAEGSK